MDSWNQEALDAIAQHDEVQLATQRADGTLGPDVTMWAVEVDGNVFVRAVRGTESPWYKRAVASNAGVLHVGDGAQEVRIDTFTGPLQSAIDEAYRAKYQRYAQNIVDSTITPEAQAATLQLFPQASE